MDSAFYSTVAQVISIFMLTGLVELRFIDRYRTTRPPYMGRMSIEAYHRLSVIGLAVLIGLSLLGALAAVSSTQTEPVPGYAHVLAKIGLAASVLFVIAPVGDRLIRLWREGPQDGQDL